MTLSLMMNGQRVCNNSKKVSESLPEQPLKVVVYVVVIIIMLDVTQRLVKETEGERIVPRYSHRLESSMLLPFAILEQKVLSIVSSLVLASPRLYIFLRLEYMHDRHRMMKERGWNKSYSIRHTTIPVRKDGDREGQGTVALTYFCTELPHNVSQIIPYSESATRVQAKATVP
jgi:hypothetical protein